MIDKDVCPKAVYYEFVKKMPSEETDLMFRGKYFEWHVLGATRDGIEPVFGKLKRGGDPKEQKDLDILVVEAKKILSEIGISPETDPFITQVHLQSKTDEGHIDLIAPDFQNTKRLALYDLKYTETKLDDRWNGWANFDEMWSQKFQAVHYVHLYHQIHDEWLPFYFLVFGKAGWVRIIKVLVTQSGLQTYRVTRTMGEEKIKEFIKMGWPPNPVYNKCRACPFAYICDYVKTVPEVESFEI